MRGPAPIGRMSVTVLFRSMPEWHSSIERGGPLGGRPAIGIALRNKNREPPIIGSHRRNGGFPRHITIFKLVRGGRFCPSPGGVKHFYTHAAGRDADSDGEPGANAHVPGRQRL